ncbi:MAG: nicotinamide mononucleotide transporter [Flavobacteriaceae bacterium]|nr:nicotinamide mononucleotide transporter [Flavobacteriaceae bacterium]MBT4113948.1 nicotinamide mononucleotide transporter [Flavobacteriaceae bacterium]MBT4613852.1 nicotinamide mononucleotide transporter [Flavobacteriaceae bacterium]MBT5246419.1 nicotinamide mononucleotide transporter [Flavobacteriaceae bacterium]MBT5650764.1 nicotinamide mononucleotide transporter [Flavobacteriaceae bacterium]
MNEIYEFFLEAYSNSPTFIIVFEFLAFVFGIISVIYAKKENILVYPTGIICTVITIYLLYRAQYFGDMMMNVYYSIMSIYGWWNWSRIKDNRQMVLISKTNKKQYLIASFFFLLTIGITFFVYKINLDHLQIPNYIDIFTSGIFFTAMWLMANKKIESWIFWIVGDIITVPLYSYRGLGILSLQYLIFLILAIQGYYEWKKTLNKQSQTV